MRRDALEADFAGFMYKSYTGYPVWPNTLDIQLDIPTLWLRYILIFI